MQYFFFIILLLSPVSMIAQMSGPGSSAIRYTSYPSSPTIHDPVFVFCNLSGNVRGTLSAIRPRGTGVYDYNWVKWNNATGTFNIPVASNTGVVSSSVTGLQEGGYKVDIIKSGVYDTSLIGWVYIDKPFSSARLQNRTCDYVALNGTAAIDTFYYNDPVTKVPVKLKNGVKFLWTSNPASTIPYPDYQLNPQSFDPPLVNVTYKLTVTDSMGCFSEASFFYESIHVKADFTAVPLTGDAPLEVAFTDKSVRAIKYKWEFGDDTTSDLQDPPPHTYYFPGEYSVKLTIESELHCIDSLRLDPKIKVEPSKLDIPNVFTPDGDGINDLFLVKNQSIRYLSIIIFSRSGKKVYEFLGDKETLNDWKGWDGNLNNTSIKATPGVYFYILKAYGWDNVKYDSKEYRGYFYLYR